MTNEGNVEGFANPPGSRKSHYFINGRSLCGKWEMEGGQDKFWKRNYAVIGNDCVACLRKLVKLKT